MGGAGSGRDNHIGWVQVPSSRRCRGHSRWHLTQERAASMHVAPKMHARVRALPCATQVPPPVWPVWAYRWKAHRARELAGTRLPECTSIGVPACQSRGLTTAIRHAASADRGNMRRGASSSFWRSSTFMASRACLAAPPGHHVIAQEHLHGTTCLPSSASRAPCDRSVTPSWQRVPA